MTGETHPNRTLNHHGALSPPENDGRWPLVLRIVASRQFTKAPQLQDILIYICKRALTDPAATIRELEIGCNALGRKPDFNPHEDNIVRVQISHLRKKLDEYFATDGRDEPVQITVPKGAYVPSFEPRTEIAEAPPPSRQGWIMRCRRLQPEIAGRCPGSSFSRSRRAFWRSSACTWH